MFITPIRNEADYKFAISRAKELWNAAEQTAERDELEILLDLIEAYERRNYPMEFPDPINAINIRLEELGLKRKDLEPCIGSRARVSEILNRRRALTLPMIRNLSKLLGLSAEALVQPYALVTESKGSVKYRRAS
ncbi:MAG: transcriptional regulator [Desulfomonilaceae bacterium]|jgi:HTH-type transcriptional regulator/antitoxin HigA